MLGIIRRCLNNDKIRYLVAGGCTTCVNLIAFYLLRVCTDINRNTCNVIAICMAITFAYFANKFFVFQSKTDGFLEAISEAAGFIGARLVSMVIEVLSFAILCDSFRINELISKISVQIVVMVLNYLLSRLFVFRSGRVSIFEKIRDDYCVYISFGIVVVLITAVAVAERVMPFGSHSLTLVDSFHQYLPFFAEYRDKLLHEGSLFYTWNVAMGSNFMSLMAYYLSSPFNYIMLLFSKENIPMVFTLLIILKLALSAANMAYFLSYRNAVPVGDIYEDKKEKSPAIIPVAVAYALSNYVIGYNWNIMWMDCIMIFPLIILGFKRLMEYGRPKLYVLSLFYCLYCNYYIGYIVCLFLVLWFFVYNHRRIRSFLVHGIRFALYSLVAGGMSAFLLLPAYYGIMSTSSASAKLPEWEWYGNIFNMFRQQLFLTKPITSQTFDGNVNLYCGMFAVLAMFLYMFDGKVRLRERIGNILLLAILMISFNCTTLNFIWHGMHDQYGIPNRFSFLYIFILLCMSYDVIKHIRKIRIPYIVIAAAMGIIFMSLCMSWSDGGVSWRILILSMLLLLIYTVLCILASARIMRKNVFGIVFSTVCLLEIVANASYGFGSNGYAAYGERYSTSEAVTEAYGRVRAIEALGDGGLYRAELMDSKVLDEASWYSMPSVGTFCSTVLGDMVHTMGKLGFYTGANEFLYMGSTPFTNSIFNVKYLFYRDGDLNNYSFDYIMTEASVDVYKNPYPLSAGFAVSENIKDFDIDGSLPLKAQNILAYDMTGGPQFFDIIYPELSASSDTCKVSVDDSVITYTPEQSGDVSFIASFTAEHTGDYYINCRGNSINKLHIYINGEEYGYDRYQAQIFHLGELQAGDYVSVEYIYKDVSTNQNTASLYMAAFDETAYRSVYEQLKQNMLRTDDCDDGYIHGTIDIGERQTVFTSIPYDEGWSLSVDGKAAGYYKVLGAFIGIDLEPGVHEIELVYTPKGLHEGMLITLVSLVIFALGVMHNSNKNSDEKLVINDDNEIDRNSNV